MNVSKALSELAFTKGSEKAIFFKESEFTYASINTISNSLAKYLMENGVAYRDNIAVILPNCPEFAFIYFASAKIGTIFTPIDARLGENEIRSILNDTKPKVCFVNQGFSFIEQLSNSFKFVDISGDEFKLHLGTTKKIEDFTTEIKPDNTALYLHTSGTTGRPKIVELSYSNLNCFPDAMRDCVVLGEKEVLGIILPMSHISGPIILNLLLTNKCKLAIIDSINPVSLFENISRHKITYFHAVPPVFNLMLKSGFAERYDTSSLDLIAMMGTSVPVSLMNAFKKSFPNVVVLQGYGLTETSPLITLTRREDADRKRASIGTPVEGAEVRVIDEEDNPLGIGEIGQLIVKGPMVMKGYLNLPEQNSQRMRNGYFYTNDLVKFDSDNYYYHMGRRDDMVVLANGQNVFPAEIQNVIFSHPAVIDAEVIGVFSEKEKGNIIHAFIVPAQNGQINENEIRSICSEQLGSIKMPKKISILPLLPKTSTGKTNIKELRNLSDINDS